MNLDQGLVTLQESSRPSALDRDCEALSFRDREATRISASDVKTVIVGISRLYHVRQSNEFSFNSYSF